MNKRKREDLEFIADILYEWAVKYGEPYVTVSAFNGSGKHAAMADVSADSPDYRAMDIYKKYETPAAATAGESKN